MRRLILVSCLAVCACTPAADEGVSDFAEEPRGDVVGATGDGGGDADASGADSTRGDSGVDGGVPADAGIRCELGASSSAGWVSFHVTGRDGPLDYSPSAWGGQDPPWANQVWTVAGRVESLVPSTDGSHEDWLFLALEAPFDFVRLRVDGAFASLDVEEGRVVEVRVVADGACLVPNQRVEVRDESGVVLAGGFGPMGNALWSLPLLGYELTPTCVRDFREYGDCEQTLYRTTLDIDGTPLQVLPGESSEVSVGGSIFRATVAQAERHTDCGLPDDPRSWLSFLVYRRR